MAAPRIHPSDAGCWFDSDRGIYMGDAVIDEAISYGFSDVPELAFGQKWSDLEDYSELWDNADRYLADLAPAGYWIGSTENGDYGMWEIEPEE